MSDTEICIWPLNVRGLSENAKRRETLPLVEEQELCNIFLGGGSKLKRNRNVGQTSGAIFTLVAIYAPNKDDPKFFQKSSEEILILSLILK